MALAFTEGNSSESNSRLYTKLLTSDPFNFFGYIPNKGYAIMAISASQPDLILRFHIDLFFSQLPTPEWPFYTRA